jgi:hypothetical protein
MEAENMQRHNENLMVKFGNSLTQAPKQSKRMKATIRTLVHMHAWLLASAVVNFTFGEAEITVSHGERPIIRRVFSDALTRLRFAQMRNIMDLFKTDQQVAREAVEDWLAELDERTNEVLKKAS